MEIAQLASAAHKIPEFRQQKITAPKNKASDTPTEASFDFVSLSETTLTATGGKKPLRCDHLLINEIEMDLFHFDPALFQYDQLVLNTCHSLYSQLIGFDPRIILFALSYREIKNELFSIPYPVKYTSVSELPAPGSYGKEGQGVIIEVLLKGKACELEYLLPGQSDYRAFTPAYLKLIAFPSGTLI